MIAGAPFAHEIDFSAGFPTGAVVYSLLGHDSLPMAGYDAVSVTPDVGALSLKVVIPGSANVVSQPLFETRTLIWSYPTANDVVTGYRQYRLDKRIPFAATADGVRAKLGVETNELEDHEIDLSMAYADLARQYDITPYATTGDLNNLLVINAIEATAALVALPSLQLAVAKCEDSGTNKYSRFGTIDWKALEASLSRHVYRVAELIGLSDDDITGITIFTKVGQTTDPLTGGNY